VLDIATGALTTVNLSATAQASTQPVTQMSLKGDLLQWTTEGSHMVLDLSNNSLWSLPSAKGFDSAYAAHGWVGWQVAPADPAGLASVTVARWAR
jgi:hypothetical protein